MSTEQKGLKRYEPTLGAQDYGGLEDCPEGEWVHYDDVAPLLDELELLRESHSRYRELIEACKLEALLHSVKFDVPCGCSICIALQQMGELP